VPINQLNCNTETHEFSRKFTQVTYTSLRTATTTTTTTNRTTSTNTNTIITEGWHDTL